MSKRDLSPQEMNGPKLKATNQNLTSDYDINNKEPNPNLLSEVTPAPGLTYAEKVAPGNSSDAKLDMIMQMMNEMKTEQTHMNARLSALELKTQTTGDQASSIRSVDSDFSEKQSPHMTPAPTPPHEHSQEPMPPAATMPLPGPSVEYNRQFNSVLQPGEREKPAFIIGVQHTFAGRLKNLTNLKDVVEHMRKYTEFKRVYNEGSTALCTTLDERVKIALNIYSEEPTYFRDDDVIKDMMRTYFTRLWKHRHIGEILKVFDTYTLELTQRLTNDSASNMIVVMEDIKLYIGRLNSMHEWVKDLCGIDVPVKPPQNSSLWEGRRSDGTKEFYPSLRHVVEENLRRKSDAFPKLLIAPMQKTPRGLDSWDNFRNAINSIIDKVCVNAVENENQHAVYLQMHKSINYHAEKRETQAIKEATRTEFAARLKQSKTEGKTIFTHKPVRVSALSYMQDSICDTVLHDIPQEVLSNNQRLDIAEGVIADLSRQATEFMQDSESDQSQVQDSTDTDQVAMIGNSIVPPICHHNLTEAGCTRQNCTFSHENEDIERALEFFETAKRARRLKK